MLFCDVTSKSATNCCDVCSALLVWCQQSDCPLWAVEEIQPHCELQTVSTFLVRSLIATNTPTAVCPWMCSYILELSARKETVHPALQQLHLTQTLGNCFITRSLLTAIPSACTARHVASKNITLYTQGQWECSMKILIYNALCFTKISGSELHVCALKLIYQIMRM